MFGIWIKYGNILAFRNVLKTLRCDYSMTIDTNISLDERFLQRMSRYCKEISKVPMPELKERLTAIEKCGFKKYEAFSCPKVLALEADEIERRFITISKGSDIQSIILPMIQCVKSNYLTSRERSKLKKCWRSYSWDGISGIEQLKKAFRCSDEKFVEICCKSLKPHKFTSRSSIPEKMEILLKYGTRLEDIWSNIGTLSRRSLELIEERAKELHRLGFNPIPFGMIDRAPAEYKDVITKLEPKPSVGNNLPDLHNVAKIKMSWYYLHKQKFDYLIEEGYTKEEILDNQEIFRNSMEAIKIILNKLREHFLGKIELRHCLNSMYHGKLHMPRLVCTFDKLKLLKDLLDEKSRKKLRKWLTGCNPKHVNRYFQSNFDFLMNEGFTIEELSKLPIILCHEVSVLRTNWESLQADDKFKKELADDKITALNRLQFHIEKKNNFNLYGNAKVDSSVREAGSFKQRMGSGMGQAEDIDLLKEITEDEMVENDDEDEEEEDEEYDSLKSVMKN